MELIKRYYIIPVLLGIFIVLFILAYKEVENRTIQDFKNQELIVARQAARGIDDFFAYYHRELEFLSGIPDIIDLDKQGKEILNSFYNNHCDQISSITMVNEKGVLTYTYPYPDSAVNNKNLTDQEHIRILLKTQQPVISDVFISVQGFVTIAYHIPVFKGSEFKGSLAILIPIDKLGMRYLENLHLRETGYAFLLSANLVELYCPCSGHTGNVFNGNADAENELAGQIEGINPADSINYRFYTGQLKEVKGDKKKSEQQILLYKIPLANTYWTIIISTPESEVYATLKGFRNRLFFSFVIVLLIMLIYFYSYAKAKAILKEEKRRRAAEKALIESEERWSFALEGNGDGVWDRNIITGEVFYSVQWKRMLGYSNNEIANTYQEWESRVHPDDFARVNELINKHISGDIDVYIAEYRMRCKDGSYKWILDRGKVMSKDESGRPVRLVGTHSDISKRKQNEEQLLTLSWAVDQSSASIIITDTEGRIEYVNKKFVDRSGYTLDEVRGKTPSVIKSGFMSDEVYNELWTTIRKGKTWAGEFQNRNRSGQIYWENAQISPVQNPEGKIVHYIAVNEDVTEKKRLIKELIDAKEKAEESDRLKSSFLQNMSHEIRTPMNAIVGFSDLLEQGEVSEEDQLSYTSIIKDSGRQLLSIVDNILTISFIDTKQEKINVTDVSIGHLVQQLYSIFINEAERKGVELRLVPDPDYPELVCKTDQTKLNQILINLISNALKFTHQGFVEVGYIIEKRWIRFHVSDSGIGIKQVAQESIFNRFSQADDSIRLSYGGTGLGLSISKAFVELLGGEITVHSEPGKGSEFIFTIPLITDDQDLNKEDMNVNSLKPERLPDATILVAEDEDFNYILIKEFFKDEKVEIIRAVNGIEAVEMCKSDKKIDLILMDIKMPELSGEKAAVLIRELRPELPVIAQSAYAIDSEIKKYMANGFDDYITKPIMKEELLQKSFRLINISR